MSRTTVQINIAGTLSSENIKVLLNVLEDAQKYFEDYDLKEDDILEFKDNQDGSYLEAFYDEVSIGDEEHILNSLVDLDLEFDCRTHVGEDLGSMYRFRKGMKEIACCDCDECDAAFVSSQNLKPLHGRLADYIQRVAESIERQDEMIHKDIERLENVSDDLKKLFIIDEIPRLGSFHVVFHVV